MASLVTMVDNIREPNVRRQLIVFGVIGLVVALILSGIYFFFLRVSYRAIFQDLRDSDAATIVADLEKRKVPYRLDDNGKTILVPAKIADSVRLAEVSADLPLKGMVGFELFNKSDIGLTEFAQKINYRRALQGELSRTIMSIDAIEYARVHLAMPDATVFRDDRQPAKASVTISPRPGEGIGSGTVLGIQQLVASAVPDLAAGDVVVLNEHGDVISQRGISADGPISPPSVTEQAAIEQFYGARVRQALTRFFPDDQIKVTVTALARKPNTDAASGGSPAQGAFSSWTPGNRQFGLNVTVAIATEFGPDVRDQIQLAAAEAIGLGAANGDMLNVVTAQMRPPTNYDPRAGAMLTPQKRDAPAPSIHTAPGIGAVSWIFVAIGALLMVFALLIPRLGRRGRISKDRRQAYGERLKALLEEEGAHVA